MTRLMSCWTVPTGAANRAVATPTKVTTASAVSLVSNIGDRRQTMNTPAVTMVAAWMSAETGVGPSIASGIQVWSPSCADLPIRSEEHTSELQSLMRISYAVFCLKKTNTTTQINTTITEHRVT